MKKLASTESFFKKASFEKKIVENSHKLEECKKFNQKIILVKKNY